MITLPLNLFKSLNWMSSQAVRHKIQKNKRMCFFMSWVLNGVLKIAGQKCLRMRDLCKSKKDKKQLKIYLLNTLKS